MPFTAQELANVANATLDFYLRQQPESQVLQDRPLFNDLMANRKPFPGGKEFIDGPVKGVYTTQLRGYEHDDEAHFANPANIKRWKAKWYELEAGIQVTFTELKKNGISVTDSTTGKSTTTHSKAELVQLVDLLEDKIEDLMEGSRRTMADMLWQDGTQDSKAIPGIQSFILTSPASGVTFGIDRAANPWWRNRAVIGIDASTPSNLNITNTLQKEMRQLRRYGSPRHKMYAGSDFLDAWERELRSKGDFTLTGWANKAAIDASMTDIAFKGILVQYDPHLDDLGLSKRLYVIDHNAIMLRPMEGEEWKMHNPARPPEKFVLYRQITYTGALCAKRLNSSGVYSIA